MKYSVTVPPDTFEAAKEAARQAGISSAEWSRLAIVAALTPKGPDPDLERARSDLACTREERDNLARDAAEVERLRVDFVTCDQALTEALGKIKVLEVQTDLHLDRVQVLEDGLRTAELKAALGEKDLERAEERLRSLQEIRDGLEERITDLRAMIRSLEGQLAAVMMQQGRLLETQSRPWWAFWRI